MPNVFDRRNDVVPTVEHWATRKGPKNLKVLTKVAHLIGVLLLVSIASFLIVDLFPGDPVAAIIGVNGTAEQAAAIRAELGLGEPIIERYVDWIGGALTGDFGRNVVPPVEDVSDQLARRFVVTAEIALLSLVLALLIAVPIGLWSGYRAGQRFDNVGSGITFGVISIPSFLAGLLVVFLFVFHDGLVRAALGIGAALIVWSLLRPGQSRESAFGGPASARLRYTIAVVVVIVAALLVLAWPSFPRQGFARISEGWVENLRSAFLPSLTLALTEAAVFIRLLRNDVISTLDEDYILVARAKGMPPRRILLNHTLRPSSLSLVTLAGISFGRLLGGTVIVEAIFGIPGMGTWIVTGVSNQDFPVVQAGVLVLAATYVTLNMLVDVAYSYLDPRIRHAS